MLFKAVKQNDPSKLMDLVLLTHCDPRTIRNERHETLLHVACQRKDDEAIDMVRALVEIYQCSPFLRDEQSSTAYHYACLSGNLNVLCYLFRSKHYNYVNDETLHPIHLKHYVQEPEIQNLIIAAKSHNVAMTRFLFMVYYHRSNYIYMENILQLKLNLYKDALNVLCKMIGGECTGRMQKHSLFNDPLHLMCKAAYEACCCGDLSTLKFYLEEVHVSMPCSKDSFGHNTDINEERSLYSSLLRAAYRLGNLHIAHYITAVKGFDPLQNAVSSHYRKRILESSDEFDAVTSESLRSLGGFYVSTYESSLHTAIRSGNMQAIKDMISQGIHCTNEYDTLLHSACISGKLEMVEVIFNKFNCLINTCNKNGDTPLHVTCEWGHLTICLFLLEQDGCSIDVTNNSGHTPLMLAIKHDRLEIFQTLLSRGASISLASASESDAENPLHLACSQKVSTFACSLLKSKEVSESSEYLNACDKHGDTPLFNACRTGNIEVVKCLVSHSHCETLFVNKYTSETPAHIACRMKRLDILELLLSRSLEKPLTLRLNHQQKSLLHLACGNDAEDIVEYLIQKQIDCSSNKDCYGHTPIHVAFMRGNTFIAKKLLESKVCKVTDVDRDKNTVLHYMCRNTLVNPELLKVLISEDAGNLLLSKKNKDENNPLHFICSNNSIQVLQLLLEYFSHDRISSELSSMNDFGDTPLHIAFRNGRTTLISFILNNPAMSEHGLLSAIRALNSQGENVLHVLMTNRFSTNNNDGTLSLDSCALAIIKILLQSTLFEKNEPILASVLCQKNLKKLTPIQECVLEMDRNGDAVSILSFLAKSKFSQKSKQDMFSVTTPDGDTLIHMAAEKNKCDIVRLLVQDKLCDIQVLNNRMQSPLHKVSRYRADSEVELLTFLCKHGCDAHQLDASGYSPLFNVMKYDKDGLNQLIDNGFWKLEKSVLKIDRGHPYYSQHYSSDLLSSSVDTFVEVPLTHCMIFESAGNKYMYTMKQITDMITTNPNLVDSLGNTTLHLCANVHFSDTFDDPLDLKVYDVNKTNHQGNTPLHIASARNNRLFINALLECDQCESVTTKNLEGHSPLFYAYDRELINCLVINGADLDDLPESYRVQNIFRNQNKLKEDNPLNPAITVLVLGNSLAGKTTFIRSLANACKWKEVTDKPSLGQIHPGKEEPERTVGVEMIEYNHVLLDCKGEQTVTRFLFYDYAGQSEFHSINFLQLQSVMTTSQSSEPFPLLLLIVLDVSLDDILIQKQLTYWTQFIENCSALDISGKPQIIIIGSHLDKVSCENRQKKIKLDLTEKMNLFTETVELVESPKLLDCRAPSSNINELQSIECTLLLSAKTLKEYSSLDSQCLVIFSYIYKHFSKKPVRFSELQRMLKMNKPEGYENDYPMMKDYLLKQLKAMHSRQHITLIGHMVEGNDFWIMTAKAHDIMFRKVHGHIFGSKRHLSVEAHVGVLSSAVLKKEFPKIDYDLLKEFLVNMEVCKIIEDESVLELIQGGNSKREEDKDKCSEQCVASESPAAQTEYMFFPGLIKDSEAKTAVWDDNEDYSYSGWRLDCSENHFLNPRFLHILLLRLTFRFVETCPKEGMKCIIWKNGIFWSIEGVEIFVEVIDQLQTVIAIFRCLKTYELKAVQERSAVVNEIRQIKAKYCQATKVTEYVMESPRLNKAKEISKVSMMELVCAVHHGKTLLRPKSASYRNLSINKDLLYFEPYAGLANEMMKSLFDPDCEHKIVSPEELSKLFSVLYKQHHIQQDHIAVLESEVRQLDPASYKNLKTLLNKYSIFCERLLSEKVSSESFMHALSVKT